MGHDPRAAAAQPAPEAEEAPQAVHEIDLEEELLGELDFAEFDEPAPAADWRDDMRAEAAADDFAPALPAAPEAVASHVSVEEAHDDASDDAHELPALDQELDFALDLDAQDDGWEDHSFGDRDEVSAEVPAAQPPVGYEAHEEVQADHAPAFDGFDADLDDDLGSALERELYSASPAEGDRETAAVAPSWQPEASSVEFEAARPVEAHDEGMIADEVDPFVEPDFDFLVEEEEVAAEAPPVVEAASDDDFDWRDEPEAAAVEPEPEPVAEAIAAAPSLEDELNQLLASHGFGSAPVAAAPISAPAAYETAQPAQPPVGSFTRANFASRSETVAAQPAPAIETPVSTLDDEDLADIFGDDFEVEEQSAPSPQPDVQASYAAPSTYAPSPAYTPRPSVMPAPVADTQDDDVLAHWQPEPLAPQAAAATHWTTPAAAAPSAPEIETQDVVESAQVVADDLDIPDLDFADEPAVPGLYDDLESEFAQAMGEQPYEEQPASHGWAASPASFAARPVDAVMPGASFEQPVLASADDFDDNMANWQDDLPLEDDPLDFDSELEQAITMASYDNDEGRPARRRSRGMLAAAVVAGVAVIGGAGVFAMSLLGGGSDMPAVVRADADPMKVRPENPGGATVPNQNNEVYQRVGGASPDAAPEQERLITTTEEPVDLAAQVEEPTMLPPGVLEGEDEIAALEGGIVDDVETALAPAMPKAEDRVQPSQDTAAAPASEDVLVTPRRVRTMIVRPDGSMVAREEPAPVAQQDTALAAAPAIPQLAPAGQVPTIEQAAALESGLEDDGGPVVETPQTVSVVPSQRREPTAPSQPVQAAQIAQPAVQQPAAQAPVAATPASVPAAAAPVAAATSEWSMQIASQPTAESAQSTYQDLARRYGNVLEGRGVNIVRADIADKGVYYRVRIPASNRDEAIQLCTRYKSAGGSCFVSR